MIQAETPSPCTNKSKHVKESNQQKQQKIKEWPGQAQFEREKRCVHLVGPGKVMHSNASKEQCSKVGSAVP